MSNEIKSTMETKNSSDENSTIMRPASKTTTTTTHAPAAHAHAVDAKHVEKVVEKAMAETAKEMNSGKEAKAATTPTKATKKDDKKEVVSTKPAKKKGKKATWVKKTKVKKDEKAKEMQDDLSGKWKPTFWGRFGKKNLRTQRDPKYAKWRKPRGIDILRERNDGELPNSGFQTPKAFRFVHPSGYREVLVQSKRDLDKIKPMHAARFSRTIGRKKRIELIQYANSKNIPILN